MWRQTRCRRCLNHCRPPASELAVHASGMECAQGSEPLDESLAPSDAFATTFSDRAGPSAPVGTIPVDSPADTTNRADMIEVVEPSTAAQPAAAGGRKSRRKKKSSTAPSKAALVDQAAAPTIAGEVALGEHGIAFVPSTVAEAGGWDNALAVLVEHGFLNQESADAAVAARNKDYQRGDPRFRFHIGLLPKYTPTMHINLQALAGQILKGWLFFGEIVKISEGPSNVALRDEVGHMALFDATKKQELIAIGHTVCASNLMQVRRYDGFSALCSASARPVFEILDIPLAEVQDLCGLLTYNPSGVCWVCNEEGGATKYCGSCRTAKYCSRDCQVKDWPMHRNKSCAGNVLRDCMFNFTD